MPSGNKSLNLFFSNNFFLGSYNDILKLPESNLREYCFVGRSNVGKSSLINAISKSKKLAKTSKTPGRTQTINLIQINKKINLIDLPGYGYAKISKSSKEKLDDLIKSYIKVRKNIYRVYVLIDCKVGIKNIDIDFLDLIFTSNKNFSIIFTKIDKCALNTVNNQVNSLKTLMNNYNNNFIEIFTCSSKKKSGIESIKKDIFNLSKK